MSKKWRLDNPKRAKEYDHKYRIAHKAERLEQQKNWRINNPERVAAFNKKYQIKRQEAAVERRAISPNARLAHVLRARLNHALKGKARFGSAVRDLGCSLDDMRLKLENQFEPGMSWDNWGEWHIDHIRPLSSFNLEDRKELLQAVNFQNLMPLWAKENLSKNDSYSG